MKSQTRRLGSEELVEENFKYIGKPLNEIYCGPGNLVRRAQAVQRLTVVVKYDPFPI